MANKTFIHGMLAEKAKQAQTLIVELLAEMPDSLLYEHQTALNNAAKSLLEVHHELRKREGS